MRLQGYIAIILIVTLSAVGSLSLPASQLGDLDSQNRIKSDAYRCNQLMCKPVSVEQMSVMGNISQAQGLQHDVLHVLMHVQAGVDPLARTVV